MANVLDISASRQEANVTDARVRRLVVGSGNVGGTFRVIALVRLEQGSTCSNLIGNSGMWFVLQRAKGSRLSKCMD